MFPRTNNRKAISTVLTTMIILVASVVLGTGVVIYGTSLFQTGAQQESITTQGVALWVNASSVTGNLGWTWGAAGIRNSGDKIVSVDSIQVRGTTVPFTSWYVDKDTTRVTNSNFQTAFNYTATDNNGMMIDSFRKGVTTTGLCSTLIAGYAGPPSLDPNYLEIDNDRSGSNSVLCMLVQSGPVTLNPGEKMIIYFKVPTGVLLSVDAGAPTGVNIFAGKAGAPTSVSIGTKT